MSIGTLSVFTTVALALISRRITGPGRGPNPAVAKRLGALVLAGASLGLAYRVRSRARARARARVRVRVRIRVRVRAGRKP